MITITIHFKFSFLLLECIENELKKQNRKVYLFVEEEDADDLETYNTEVDYVSLDILPNEKVSI